MVFTVGLLRILELTTDDALVVALEGDLDLQTAPDLCARLTRHRGRKVVLDASRLHFCDSCGLRAIMCEARENAIIGGHLVIVAPTGGSARRIFELTGLADVLDVAQDRATAVALA
jgi:anti-anti-sigma factor